MANHGIMFKTFMDELMRKKNEITRFNIGGKNIILANKKEKLPVNVVEEALQRIEGESKKRLDKRKVSSLLLLS